MTCETFILNWTTRLFILTFKTMMRRTFCILWIGTGLCARPTFFRTLLGQDRELITWNNQETPAFPEKNSVMDSAYGIPSPTPPKTALFSWMYSKDIVSCQGWFRQMFPASYTVSITWQFDGLMLDVVMFALQVSPGLSCQSLNSMTSMCCTRCRNSRPTVHNLPYMFAFWVILVSLFRHLDT